MRCRTSRDAPTRASASFLMEPMSWRTSAIAGPANPLSAFTAARTPSAAAMIAPAATSAARAMITRLSEGVRFVLDGADELADVGDRGAGESLERFHRRADAERGSESAQGI